MAARHAIPARPSSVTVWRGPSMINGEPIRVVVTGITRPSQNRKTGAMAQVWILTDDTSPVAALQSGADQAICGSCPLAGTVGEDGRRQGRACYVNVGQAPQSAWRGQGTDPTVVDPATVGEWLAGKPVRLGAYGDPAAAPFEVMAALVRHASKWTGYTHQWATCDQRFRELIMASADSVELADKAHANGWRTFRVSADGERVGREITCPSERGRSCADCGACDGTRYGTKIGRVSIVIAAHGSGSKYVTS